MGRLHFFVMGFSSSPTRIPASFLSLLPITFFRFEQMIVGSLGTVESFPVLFSVKMLSRDGWDGHGHPLVPCHGNLGDISLSFGLR